jgi:type VI secretion system protein ImpE
MTPAEYIKAGQPLDALRVAMDEVRKRPAAQDSRVSLFQLFCVTGQYQKALNQLEVLEKLNDQLLPLVRTYQALIQAEQYRSAVFAGEYTPLILGKPPVWMAGLLNALTLQAEGKSAEAQQWVAEALQQAPGCSGRINQVPFEWIADGDSRLGPVLEVIVNGKYYWVPFERIKSVHIEPPQDCRDLVWCPARFTWQTEGQMVGFIPTRYIHSEASGDGLLMLARKTEWQDVAAEFYVGLGQRMLMTNQSETALLDVRDIELDAIVTPDGQ